MARDPRHDVLFEPVSIGPVTAPNRFYQTPQCSGMGRNYPSPWAVMRGIKAEGGWGVVFAEQCDMHHSTDNVRNVRIWDKQDTVIVGRMVEEVHAHGSLAGLMLAHNGFVTPNLISRETPLAPSLIPSFGVIPAHARALDKQDIGTLRAAHRTAALRARDMGFDIVNVYAGHTLALPMHFIARRYNQRTDEYGGSLENRVRLLRELLEDTKDAIGDSCAVGIRFSVDEMMGEAGITCEVEGREVVEMLAELPDIWDVNVASWAWDSITSRFGEEGSQEDKIAFVKQVTTRPVVGVGRFTSPDAMVSQIRRGILDIIGAARPTIADPFLPKKIEEGRPEDIRECIGCNICTTNNYMVAPIRCTQNPTMGEEWRRGWHPERIAPADTDDRILIVGAGPAGLEAARALGERGYPVMLAEARDELGGRVSRESRLPGLAAWARVRDWRLGQIDKLTNVGVFRGSAMDADAVLETEATLVGLATGATWRRDGIGRYHRSPIPGADAPHVLTPDEIMDGAKASGPVVIWDDDHYYMASVMAEALANAGHTVTIVTSQASIAPYTQFTLELDHIHRRMASLGVVIMGFHALAGIGDEEVELKSVHGGPDRFIPAGTVLMVAGMTPNDALARALDARNGGPRVVCFGDCHAPSIIATAVYAGHRFARNLNLDLSETPDFLREDVAMASAPPMQRHMAAD
ncbi:MAG: NAD(P)-binding protein [Rhodospirillales bacterium]|nr:NAD(P)-binding protein [Rhodospirillales bacterium]